VNAGAATARLHFATPALAEALEQLVFELAAPEPPRFDNFLPGRNAELVATLERFACGELDETGMLIWGATGAGKTHLLRAAVALAQARGRSAVFLEHPERLHASLLDDAPALLAVDRVDEADAAAAGHGFTLYNALKERHAHFLAASRQPLAAMGLREDFRTRLGWGLVYEALALSDDDKPAALAVYAARRGFQLSADVIEYLLRHGRRDMGSLLAALAALDRQSLSTKKPITVALLKTWLQRELEWTPNRNDASTAS
jgi:DnaA family protein